MTYTCSNIASCRGLLRLRLCSLFGVLVLPLSCADGLLAEEHGRSNNEISSLMQFESSLQLQTYSQHDGQTVPASASTAAHPVQEPQSLLDFSLDGQFETISMIEDAPSSIPRAVPTEHGVQVNSTALWCFFAGVVCFSALLLSLPCLHPAIISYLVCAIYILVSVTIDLSIAIQKTSQTDSQSAKGPYQFNTKCAVLLTELIKLVVSLGLAGFNSFCERKRPDVTFGDVQWLLLPAMLFTANNVLVYQAIGKNNMAAFGVFRDTMILWTALIWRSIFQTQLGWTRLVGIGVIFAGLTLNRVGGSAFTWAFLWVLVMTLTNALGSVANEFALKRSRKLDINVQNAILYMACASFAILLLALDDPSRLMGPTTFFHGFTGNTFFTLTLQAFAGLMVSRMLKYADSVTKTVACCLRGPVVVFVSPYLLAVPNTWSELMSAIVVASGCTVYLLRGPLQSREEAGKKLPSTA